MTPMLAFLTILAAAILNSAAELGRTAERYEPAGRLFDITVRITQPPHAPRGSFYGEDAPGKGTKFTIALEGYATEAK